MHDIISFFAGVLTTLVVVYKYISSRISSEEAKRIYEKAKEAINEYKKAKEDGTITTEEKLQIADKAIEVIDEILKDLGD